MIEELVIYHDDNNGGTHAELGTCRNSSNNKQYVEIHIKNDVGVNLWLNFDSDTAKAFANDILRKVEQIEKEEE